MEKEGAWPDLSPVLLMDLKLFQAVLGYISLYILALVVGREIERVSYSSRVGS